MKAFASAIEPGAAPPAVALQRPADVKPKSDALIETRLPLGILIICLFVLVGLMVGLVAAFFGWDGIRNCGAPFFFWLELLYLVLLIMSAFFYIANVHGVRALFPPLLAGVLPIAVPWFGAIGAVLIGLQGVYEHGGKPGGQNWDTSYNYWHAARPISGAILGTIAFFMLALLNIASGTTPAFFKAPDAWEVKDVLIYCMFAFLIGYREKTFRDLVAKVTDLILGPSQNAVPVNPSTVTVLPVNTSGGNAETAPDTPVDPTKGKKPQDGSG